MKNVFIGITVLFCSQIAFATQMVEGHIERVFLPPSGYDSNDNVQVMIDGVLPNQCQQIAKTEITFDSANREFRIRQWAQIRPIADCQRRELPPYLGIPGRYTKEVSLGVLPAGEYKVSFQQNGIVMRRGFLVAAAQTSSTDDAIYAPVSDFFVPEMVKETESVQIVLTGVIGSRCLGWKNIEVDRFHDIMVIKPKMKFVSTNFCSDTPWALEKVVSLGRLKPGRYMIHVRSMNGQALSRIFSVIPDVDVSGRSRPN